MGNILFYTGLNPKLFFKESRVKKHQTNQNRSTENESQKVFQRQSTTDPDVSGPPSRTDLWMVPCEDTGFGVPISLTLKTVVGCSLKLSGTSYLPPTFSP